MHPALMLLIVTQYLGFIEEITPGIHALHLRSFFERSILLQAKLVLRALATALHPLILTFSATAPALLYHLHPCRRPLGGRNLVGLQSANLGYRFSRST